MNMAAIAAGVVALGAWMYVAVAHRYLLRVKECSSKNICGKTHNANASIVAVIPARNERATIARAVTSLVAQEFTGKLNIIVVDDQSDDGTAEAARAAGNEKRMTVIDGQALPSGWTGKVWAMQQGIEMARAYHPDFLLLTDADVVHAPTNVAALVTIAQEGGYDMVSFMVRLHCRSTAEQLLIPAFVFFFLLLYPPPSITDPRKKIAGAAGGCMLVRSEALQRAGGMESIRAQVIDDCALARVLKQSGGRVWLGLSEDTESVREYRSFAEIGRMIARTAFNQLKHSTALLIGAMVAMTIAFIFPVVLVCLYPALANTGLGRGTLDFVFLNSGSVPLLLGGAAWALMTAIYLPMVRFYRRNPLWAVTLPLAASFYMGATVWSAMKYWSGRGGDWKGRVQDQRHG